MLGVIADDITGATDIASALNDGGMSVVVAIGTAPIDRCAVTDTVDAVVVGLKIRAVPADEAVAASTQALAALQSYGIERFFWKYCSTFDSTAAGNIGPVAEALRSALRVDHAIVTPAFVENGRQVFQGHLFVDGVPLAESSMRDHPLTPMTDSDVRRLMTAQLTFGRVAHQNLDLVRAGPEALRRGLDADRTNGATFSIVDAIASADLETVSDAVIADRLVTGSAGVARPLAAAYRRQGLLGNERSVDALRTINGPTLILAGSASAATRRQLETAAAFTDPIRLDPLELSERGLEPEHNAMVHALQAHPVVAVASTNDPDELHHAQRVLGTARAAALIEAAMAELAQLARNVGVRRFIVAGGETSGAVTASLGASLLQVGPTISPGVPWTMTLGDDPIAIACKSGNFGGDEFFDEACTVADRCFGSGS